MEITSSEVTVKGRIASVPSLVVNDRKVVCEGKWLKIARVYDEVWLEGQPVENPDAFIAALKKGSLGADLFTFAQVLPQTERQYNFHVEWDNLAVAPTSDFKAWWEGMPQESRKNVRRSERRGAVVRAVDFNEELVRGIKNLYDETPIRQGRRFWHYGKDFETVKRENSSYLERGQFIAAFYKEELIGFLKMVYVGSTARIMQILSQNRHFDKRPTNALLAKAVEVCNQRGISQLVYGQYIYDNKKDSPVTEFKRRNGFHQVLLPRYYIPLTHKGGIALASGFHRGIKSRLPSPVLSWALGIRNSLYERFLSKSKGGPAPAQPEDARGAEERGA
jgi:hypothetical protein